jgi:sulfate transport system permease protein
VLYLSVIVLLPLAAVTAKGFEGGIGEFWNQVTQPQGVAALKLTLAISLVVTVINVVMGTLIAWVLVRDDFRGKSLVNSLIDLPFALPTIVAGLTLLALYGSRSPIGIDVAYTRVGIAMALLFVTLPFVVRAVQPTLQEADREMEEAAASLGARPWTIFSKVILPNLRPAIVAGASLAFARALGEFGSVVLISGNLPYKTEVSSNYIFGQIENDNVHGAAAMSVVLLLASLVVLAAVGRLGRRQWGA